MADDTLNNQTTNQPADNTQATDAVNTATVTDFDTSKLSDEQILKVLEDQRLWKSERLSKLREKAKTADELTAAQKQREDEEAMKRGEHEKLLEQSKNRITELETQIRESKVSTEIRDAATKLGAIDPAVVAKLIDRSGIQIAEDGTVSGVDDAVKGLLESSPYLKGKNTVPAMGTASNPSGDGQTTLRKFTMSQIRDHSFYKQHEKEIDAAFRAGLIEDDLSTA